MVCLGNLVFWSVWLHESSSLGCCWLISYCFPTSIPCAPEVHQRYPWTRWWLPICSAALAQGVVPGTDTSLPPPVAARLSVSISWLQVEWAHGVLAQSMYTPAVRNTPLQVLYQRPSLYRWGLTSPCRRCHHRREQLNHYQAGWHLLVLASLVNLLVETGNPLFIR